MPAFPRRKHIAVWVLPFLISSLTMTMLVGALFLAAVKADEAAARRQEGLLQFIVANLESSLAHEQESATVWDDAVKFARLKDTDWLAANLGEWMHTYFEHDAALVLKNDGQVIYDFIADPSAGPDATDILKVALPLTQTLKRRLEAGQRSDSARILSIGESDLSTIAGRAAIVSVKPIVSDSGEIIQNPGDEYLHVAVRYLDGKLPGRIAEDYRFADLGFSRSTGGDTRHSSVALTSNSGETIGYFRWLPFSPGSSVLSDVYPIIILVGLLTFCLMSLLFHTLWRRSLNLKASQEELEHLALHDPLTGLANRANFSLTLEQRLLSLPQSQSLAVLFIDLDHFKAVNDSYGHPVGDALIKEVASRLSLVAPSAFASRLGGDEFTMLVEMTEGEDVEQLARDIIASLRNPFPIDTHHIVIGASVGICISTPEVAADDLIRHADIALYHAKAAGRNTYAVFGAHMEKLLRRRREIETDLAFALEDGTQLEVHYQPVYSAGDGEISSLEALCRWHHPRYGALSPDDFIPIAEESGLIQKLGHFVLEDACNLLSEMEALDLTIAVNASAIELMSPGYALRVLNTLARYGVGPTRFEIEITERIAADGDSRIADAIRLLRSAGVRFAVDDFGRGNSSFGQRLNLEVDRIKIDKMFVDGIQDGGGMPLIEAIVQMARHKGLKTTAEGIETKEQREVLTMLGCDSLQGFELSRPLNRSQVVKLVTGTESQRSRAV